MGGMKILTRGIFVMLVKKTCKEYMLALITKRSSIVHFGVLRKVVKSNQSREVMSEEMIKLHCKLSTFQFHTRGAWQVYFWLPI